MAIITFVSDYGIVDHYVASVKARILSFNAGLQIVDISHNIEHYNLAHGSFVLKSVFREFPAGTVHLTAIHDAYASRFLALKLEDHFFIGADNGLFSLISEDAPEQIVELPMPNQSTFPALNILAVAAAQLATGTSLQDLGISTTNFQQLIGRKVRATKKQISGHVIRVDHYGNLITNIEKQVFDILNKNKDFTIVFGREKHRIIHKAYSDTEAGDCFVLFNSLGLLEIGINNGNANELLGLDYDSPVMLIFNE